MEIHYKSVHYVAEIPNPHIDNFIEVIGARTKYCCKGMKEAIKGGTIKLEPAFESPAGAFLQEPNDDYPAGLHSFYPSISFCPFCAAPVALVEDFKVERYMKTVTVPARKEKRLVERRVKDEARASKEGS